MVRSLSALCLLATVLGCSNSSPLVQEMEALTNEVCACKDEACAKKVTAKLAKFALDMGKRFPKGIAETEKAEIDALQSKFSQCELAARGPSVSAN